METPQAMDKTTTVTPGETPVSAAITDRKDVVYLLDYAITLGRAGLEPMPKLEPGRVYNGVDFGWLIFQDGPIDGENFQNGTFNETLLHLIANRFEVWQAGPFACSENEEALYHVRRALNAMHRRTAARERQGVEGKDLPHVSEDLTLAN